MLYCLQLKPTHVLQSGDHMIRYYEILDKQGHPDPHCIVYNLSGPYSHTPAAKKIKPLEWCY